MNSLSIGHLDQNFFLFGNTVTFPQTPRYDITTLLKRVPANEKQTTLALLSFASL